MAVQKQPDGFFPNIFAGGVAGGVAAVATSPLDVIKTRLQSSTLYGTCPKQGLRRCLRDAVSIEGGRALFKGLGVTLLGVIPSRAVYFTAYTQGKKLLSDGKRSPFQIHVLSSVLTGAVNVTWSNPLFVIRTRQQLKVDSRGRPMLSFWKCCLDTYRADGLLGFTRGISASYVGIVETVIALVLWERFKKAIFETYGPGAVNSALAAAGAKLIATTIAYPHEVIRTRLRETSGPNRKFISFRQTVSLTITEEGFSGLYRGLLPQLFRVVPNHAIMFLTFELVMKYYTGSHDLPSSSLRRQS